MANANISNICSVDGCGKKILCRNICGAHYLKMKRDTSPRLADLTSAQIDKIAAKFWELVDRTGGANECWSFYGERDDEGYGRFYLNYRKEFAHRVAFVLHNKYIVGGSVVRHKCDNPPCCNPKHLLLGTNSDNVQDRTSRGRDARGTSITRSILTEDQVVLIKERIRNGERLVDIARDLSINQGVLSKIKRGVTWAWL